MKFQKITPILLCTAMLFLISCGKDKPGTPSPPEKASTESTHPAAATHEDTINTDSEMQQTADVVDADKFSSAFSDITENAGAEPDNKEKKAEKTSIELLKKKYFDCGALAENRFTNKDFQQNELPDDCIAAKIGGKEKYSWLPHWIYTGKGGVRIPDADISEDKSLIALIENVPGPGSKNSTLLILIDTYKFDIRAIYFFAALKLTSVKFIPETLDAVAWNSSQTTDDDIPPSGNLLKINLTDGTIAAESIPIEAESANFAVGKGTGKIVLKADDGKNKLYIYSSENITSTPITTESSQPSGKVAVSHDAKLFALAGKNKIEVFKFSDNMKLKEIKADTGVIPDDFTFAGSKLFAELSYSHPMYLVSESEMADICPSAGGKLFIRQDINSLVFEQYLNRAISIFNLKTLKITDTFIPEKLKPKTVGQAVLLNYLPGINRYILLDDNGNLSLFHKPGRRWRKKVIFVSDK